MKKIILCIGRQYGSGGREAGERLSKKLNIPLYDKEIIKKAALDSGLVEALFEKADEKPSNSFWSTLWVNNPAAAVSAYNFGDYLTNDKLFMIQSEAIKKLADEGSCIIIGRCAEYILRDNPAMSSVFIFADMQARIERIMKIQGIDAQKAETLIIKEDKKRSGYHDYYAGGKWGVCTSYDMAVSTSAAGMEEAVELMHHYCLSKMN